MASSKQLYVAKIVHSTSTDGVGLRNSLYLSGCNLRCPDCHNKVWWDIESGAPMSINKVYDSLNIDDCNISILGGEPLMQYDEVVELCEKIKKDMPHKNIWLWSGYTLEQIKERFADILLYIDVLIDGPYIKELHQPGLLWRGSTNQRIIELYK